MYPLQHSWRHALAYYIAEGYQYERITVLDGVDLRGRLGLFARVLIQLKHDLEDLICHLWVLFQVLFEDAIWSGLVTTSSIGSITNFSCALNVYHFFLTNQL